MKIFLIAYKDSILSQAEIWGKITVLDPQVQTPTEDRNGFYKILKECLTSNWPSEKHTVL